MPKSRLDDLLSQWGDRVAAGAIRQATRAAIAAQPCGAYRSGDQMLCRCGMSFDVGEQAPCEQSRRP
jgi:hypothetical protein